MKLILSAILLSAPAFAAPDCWTLSGEPIGPNKHGVNIADGQFLLTIELDAISKENLVLVLQKAKFGNIKPAAYPTFLDDLMVLPLESVSEDTARPALMEAVNGQIDELLAIPGVKGADCNGVTGLTPLQGAK